MKNLIIQSEVVRLVKLSQPIEIRGVKADGTAKTRQLLYNLELMLTPSVELAIKATNALVRDDDKQAQLCKIDLINKKAIFGLDSIQINALANSCGIGVKQLRLVCMRQPFHATVQLRDAGDVIEAFDKDRNKIEIEVATSHASLLNDTLTIELSERVQDRLLRALGDDDADFSAEPLVRNVGVPAIEKRELVFVAPKQKAGEPKKDYTARILRDKESFAAKHNLVLEDVKVS